MAAPHLLVAITSHGFGHAAMTAPVLNTLRRMRPDIRITLQTNVSRWLLDGRIDGPFDLTPESHDFGIRMHSAIVVDPEATARDYVALHARLKTILLEEGQKFRDLGVDGVLSNISYIAIAAASRVGLPAMGMSCLNWADLYEHCCAGRPEVPGIAAEMRAAYETAGSILCCEPFMPMRGLSNTRVIGPMARAGQDCRGQILRVCGLDSATRIGLIGFGGMDVPLRYDRWARLPGWHWLTTAPVSGRPDMTAFETVGLRFVDSVRSCDVVVTKPGYGTFTEAAANGTPVLYLPRPDWPEARHLEAWLRQHAVSSVIEAETLMDAVALERQLALLLAAGRRCYDGPLGMEEAATAVLEMMERQG